MDSLVISILMFVLKLPPCVAKTLIHVGHTTKVLNLLKF
jgi:hypothetical protein